MTYTTSFLDDDLYKFTQQQAVLKLFPHAKANYRFHLRRKVKFNKAFADLFRERLARFEAVRITDAEAKYLETLGLFTPDYIAYLRQYRFQPHEQVDWNVSDEDLSLDIKGPWHSTILWEVRLMALISQTYFETCDTNWSYDDQIDNAAKKFQLLTKHGVPFADFGTRRRRSARIQEIVVHTFANHMVYITYENPVFLGTSNVELAMRFKVKPIGTMAHEWIMGNSGLVSLRHANKVALENWANFYRGKLGIALTDTFTTSAFFKDFDGYLARLYDGVRHDSADPYIFADKVVAHYRFLGIDPSAKTIVFSDGLNPEECVKIKAHCDKLGIRSVYGIGTNFTNDFAGSKPLNMVIKLRSIDGVDVIKLSDEPTKATGESSALAEARHVFLGQAIAAKDQL